MGNTPITIARICRYAPIRISRSIQGFRPKKSGTERETKASGHLEALLSTEGFVGGGAVEAGDGDVVEAEVDAELGDVVNHVVEEEAAEHGGSGFFADELLAEAEAPGLLEGFVVGVDERAATLLCGVVERFDGVGAALPVE